MKKIENIDVNIETCWLRKSQTPDTNLGIEKKIEIKQKLKNITGKISYLSSFD